VGFAPDRKFQARAAGVDLRIADSSSDAFSPYGRAYGEGVGEHRRTCKDIFERGKKMQFLWQNFDTLSPND
jgi:hypothetical protein